MLYAIEFESKKLGRTFAAAVSAESEAEAVKLATDAAALFGELVDVKVTGRDESVLLFTK